MLPADGFNSPKEHMAKPNNPKPVKIQKAPKAARPKAPLVRISENPTPVQRTTSRDAKGKSHPKAAGTKQRTTGAQINRRAADRLREGYLWVYASDIETLELPDGDPPALLPVADSRGLLLDR